MKKEHKRIIQETESIAQAKGPKAGADHLMHALKATKTLKGPGGKSTTVPDHSRRLAAVRAIVGPPKRKTSSS